MERVPTERSTGTTTRSAPLLAVDAMDQPVGKQTSSMLRNPSEFMSGLPGRETEARYPDTCHTLASTPGGISGVSGGSAARYGDNTPPIAASAIGAVEEVKPHSGELLL